MSRDLKVIMIDSLTGNDYSLFLCNELKKCGTDITLFVPRGRRLLGNENFSVKELLPSKQENKSRILKTLSYIKYILILLSCTVKKPGIIHFQFFRIARIESILFYLMNKLGVQLVYTVHDVEPLNNSRTDAFFNSIVYNSAAALIVHSEINRKMLEKKSPGFKISVINHGSYKSASDITEISKHCAREKLGLNDENDVILFFGFIKEYKGLDLLFEAFSYAAQENKNLVLIIAGAPETQKINNTYLNMVKSSPASERIIFHNRYIPENEFSTYFKSADVTILPYRNISHSGVLHLSYSFGTPVIVTDTGDLSYLVNKDKTGFTAQRNNPADLADKITAAFSDKEKLLQMGENALKASRTEYS
jgi:D-inositol-3-phosphate glycosyltransferase